MRKTLVLILALLMILALAACSGKPENAGTETGDTETGAVLTVPDEAPVLFVSPDGDDSADGSEEHPFATAEAAKERIRAFREAGYTGGATVNILPGHYAVTSMVFTETDGGKAEDSRVIYQKHGDGEVIFDAAFTFDGAQLRPAADGDGIPHFADDAKEHILVADLAGLGLTREQIGEQYAFGTYTRISADFHPELFGTNIGVFADGARLIPARYPNLTGEFASDDSVCFIGEGDIVSAEDGTVRVSDETASRIEGWASTENVWVFGYFKFNWADETSVIVDYDADANAMTLLTNSYGYAEGGDYYFFNIPEELDRDGEYWIDRDSMKLYLYDSDGKVDSVSLALSRETMISGNASWLTFDGITFTGVCGDLITLDGDSITVENCLFSNSEGSALTITGVNETVRRSEVRHLGKRGIMIRSGSFADGIVGNTLVENNYVHHFEEVWKTYQDGIWVDGYKNIIRHNEAAYSPHSTICATGNDNLMEWNYVHDAVQESDDAGAFYSGGRWLSAGNVMQYNKFERIGNAEHCANGIYFDDMLSGWTAQYNLLVDVYGWAIICGGGRDLHITNNVVINNVDGSYFYYDERMRENYLAGVPSFVNMDGGMWASISAFDLKSDPWASAYPVIAAITCDTSDPDNRDFPINPAYSVVKDNIFVGPMNKWKFHVTDSVYVYSEIGEYLHNEDASRIFEEGSYELNKVGKRSKIEYTPVPYTGFGIEDKT